MLVGCYFGVSESARGRLLEGYLNMRAVSLQAQEESVVSLLTTTRRVRDVAGGKVSFKVTCASIDAGSISTVHHQQPSCRKAYSNEMMLARWTCLQRVARPQVLSAARPFTASAATHEKALPPRRKITDNEITESFLRGTGPGGQKINKTSCAVQLKHLATGIVVKSQHTRSREQNRKFARLLLGEKLDQLEKGEDSRTAIKTERARVKKASANKKTKRKYKKLDEAKAAAEGSQSVDEGEASLDDANAVSEQPPAPGQNNDSTTAEKSS